MTDYLSTQKTGLLTRLAGKTGVLYIRVSSYKQVDNFSIPTQIEEGRKYFAKNNITQVGIFFEKGESAKTASRTEFQNLLYFLSHNKNKVDYVVFYKVDRWASVKYPFF